MEPACLLDPYGSRPAYPGKIEVLRNLTLELRQGEILGLVGRAVAARARWHLAILSCSILSGEKPMDRSSSTAAT